MMATATAMRRPRIESLVDDGPWTGGVAIRKTVTADAGRAYVITDLTVDWLATGADPDHYYGTLDLVLSDGRQITEQPVDLQSVYFSAIDRDTRGGQILPAPIVLVPGSSFTCTVVPNASRASNESIVIGFLGYETDEPVDDRRQPFIQEVQWQEVLNVTQYGPFELHAGIGERITLTDFHFRKRLAEYRHLYDVTCKRHDGQVIARRQPLFNLADNNTERLAWTPPLVVEGGGGLTFEIDYSPVFTPGGGPISGFTLLGYRDLL